MKGPAAPSRPATPEHDHADAPASAGHNGAEPIADVLARIRCELEDIAGRIDRNQAAIARSTWAAGAADAGYVSAMQDADLSAQRIAGIATFLSALAKAANPKWSLDTAPAAKTITLAALAQSIGTTNQTSKTQNSQNNGNIELF